VSQALDGIRVVEAATLFAAPLAGMFLADYGADVIKIEHPARVDPARGHGPSKDGEGLWFKALGRNKRLITLDLSKTDGRDLFLRLGELVHDLVVALRGERAVLLLRGQVLRVLRVEVLDAAVRAALRVDGGGATCDLGAELLGLVLRGGDEGVSLLDVVGRLGECVLGRVDLLVERAELLGVGVDLAVELCGFRLLVADRVGDRNPRCGQRPHRCHEEGEEDEPNRSAVHMGTPPARPYRSLLNTSCEQH